MRKLVIHVGFGKTGSSAIQRSLRANSGMLHDAGIYYCDIFLSKSSVGEYGFSAAAEFSRFLGGDKARLADRLLEIFNVSNPRFSGMHTVVWSNEALAAQSSQLAPFINRIQANYNLRIVLYLRNQVDWLVSAYSQWAIKDKQAPGRVRTWQTFLNDTTRSVDYISVIEGWRASCGADSLEARSYDTIENIVEDFCIRSGIEVALQGSGDRVYETPNYSALSLFKVFNDQFAEAVQPEPLLSLMEEAGVLKHDLHSVDPCPLDVSCSSLDELMAGFADVNRRLFDDYGIELKRSKTSALVGRRSHSSEVNTDLIAGLIMMILSLDRRTRELQALINRSSRQVQEPGR